MLGPELKPEESATTEKQTPSTCTTNVKTMDSDKLYQIDQRLNYFNKEI